MDDIYTNGNYLKSNPMWHTEDSAWKAARIAALIAKHGLRPHRVAEVGCGAGDVLRELSERDAFAGSALVGYDISPHAISLAQRHTSDRISYRCEDPFAGQSLDAFDLLLAIDVFEHVDDYLGFLRHCANAAEFKIYHIPLEIHVSALLRDTLTSARYTVGHIHYFNAASALAALRDTNHRVIDAVYTQGALALFRQHATLRRALANGPRWLIGKFNVALSARLLGGYSLLVLAR